MFTQIVHAQIIAGAPRLQEILMNVMQFVLEVAGLIAVLGIIAAGVIYMTAGGNESRAQFGKRALRYTITGLVVVVASLVLINTLDQLAG